MSEQIVAAVVAALVSAVVSLLVAWSRVRQTRDAQRSQIQHEITSKYDRMIEYRLERPEVMASARKWEPGCFRLVYDHTGPDGDRWAIYYGYVELITLYCSAVLHARSHGLIDKDIYISQHEPLIRLLLAEHYPIFSTIIHDRGYVSKYLADHVTRLREREGWNWLAAYVDLVGEPARTESTPRPGRMPAGEVGQHPALDVEPE